MRSDLGYEVWLLGYNDNEEATDFEVEVFAHKNPDIAVDRAIELMGPDKLKALLGSLNIRVPKEVEFIEVRVEHVVDDDGDIMSIDTLFSEFIKI